MGQQPPPPGAPEETGGTTAPTTPTLPTRYRFESALGEGGLGTVVKAYDTHLRAYVAIKTIRHDLARTNPQRYEYFRARFEREAIAGASVRSSPYIVTVYDQLADRDGDLFLILEYVPGGTLRDRLISGPLPVAAALRIIADVARGLLALHEAEIVHRDIKPENIFIAADGRALVGDLGIVQMSISTFRTRLEYGSPQGHPGTPLYMSPEQASTTDALTAEADQFSLGAVLFETVTGRRFKAVYDDDREELLGAMPAGLAALIRRMTAADPAARYRGMEAVLAAIQAVDPTGPSERAVTVPSPLPTPGPAVDMTIPDNEVRTPRVDLYAPYYPLSTSRPVRRRAVLVGIGGAVVAGGAAGGVWALIHHGPTPLPPTGTPVVSQIATSPAAPTAPPGTATPALRGATASWTDPEHRVAVRYPTSWSKNSFEDTRDENGTVANARSLLELTGPDKVSLSFSIYISGDTLDGDVVAIRTQLMGGSSPATLTPTRDTVIGGEPAKAFDGTYVYDGGTVAAAVWIVTHGNRRFGFSADKIGAHRTEVDAIVGATTFLSAVGTPASTVTPTVTRTVSAPTIVPSPTMVAAVTATAVPPSKLIAWQDAMNRVSLSYPDEYHPDVFKKVSDALALIAPDQTTFTVAIAQPTSASTQDLLTTYINAWQAGQAGDAKGGTLHFEAPVNSGRVANEPSSVVRFSYNQATSNTPMQRIVWFVRHRDLSLQMESSLITAEAKPTRADEANAIANSVKFLT